MAKQALTPQQACVLVVEDDPNNRLVLVKLLQLAGVRPENIFQVEGDAAAYLRAQPDCRVDLILLDLQLPGKDGYTILQELRVEPGLAGIPVIALTANVMRHDVERAQAAGFDGFIGKPIDAQHFPEQIQDILVGKRVWRAV